MLSVQLFIQYSQDLVKMPKCLKQSGPEFAMLGRRSWQIPLTPTPTPYFVHIWIPTSSC